MIVNNSYYTRNDLIEPLDFEDSVIVAMDPSKSGFHVVVGDLYGNEIWHAEIVGKGMDTGEFVDELEEYLLKKLATLNIHTFAREQTILKKGFEFYRSSEVLNDIKATVDKVSRALGKKIFAVNNFAWKGSILPDGYRGHSEKGSLRYWKEVDPEKFANATDNYTDAYSIYKFCVKNAKNVPPVYCCQEEKSRFKYICKVVPNNLIEADKFEFNYKYTVAQNSVFFSNRKIAGKSVVDLNKLSFNDIYCFCAGFEEYNQTGILLVSRI